MGTNRAAVNVGDINGALVARERKRPGLEETG